MEKVPAMKLKQRQGIQDQLRQAYLGSKRIYSTNQDFFIPTWYLLLQTLERFTSTQKRHLTSIALVRDRHVEDLSSRPALGLRCDEIAQRLESTGLDETHSLPLVTLRVLAFHLLHKAQNFVLDGA